MKFIKSIFLVILISFFIGLSIGIQLKSKSNYYSSEFLGINSKLKGSFSEVPLKLNFHGKTFTDEPLISCTVKVKFETKNCSFKETSSSSGRLIFTLEEAILNDNTKITKENSQTKSTNETSNNQNITKNTSNGNNEQQMNNNTPINNLQMNTNNQDVTKNTNTNFNQNPTVSKDTQFPQFKEVLFNIDNINNDQQNINNNSAQNNLEQNNQNPSANSNLNQVSQPSQPAQPSQPLQPSQLPQSPSVNNNTESLKNTNTSQPKPNANSNDNKIIASDVLKTTYKQCENRLKRLSLNGILDSRLFKNCETTLTTSTSGAHSIKFTIYSRESEDNNEKNVELVIPNDKGISKQDIDVFMQSINTSCKQSTEDINAKVKEMKNIFCSSIKMPKGYKKCDEISDELSKDKCNNISNQIKSMNQELQNNQQLLNKSDNSNSECNNKAKHLSTKLELFQINKKEASEIYSQLQKTADELTKEIGELNQQKENFSKNVQSKKDKLVNLNEKISTLNKQLDEGNKIKSAESNELMVSQKNMQEYQKSISDQDQKIVKLKEDLRLLREKTQKETNMSSNEQELKQNNLSESSKLNNNLSLLEADFQKIDKEISEMEAIVKMASEENSKLNAEKEKMKTSLDSINKDISDVQSKSANQCKRILEISPSPIQKKLKVLCENSMKGDKSEINMLDDIIKLLKV